MHEPYPLLLTARFDPRAAALFQALRDRHFPPERNLVPAHCTLFHALPGAEAAAIVGRLRSLCEGQAALPFAGEGVRFLGRGVALAIASPGLVACRAALARDWARWLTPQDRQGFRPHVTVQNKVAPAQARALQAVLAAAPPAVGGDIVGLDLWHYRGGPWEAAGAFTFGG